MRSNHSLIKGTTVGPAILAFTAGVVALLSAIITPVRAATFDDGAPPLNETTLSIGVFKVVVEPAFRSALAGYPGYRNSSHTITSPMMYDFNTIVGRSAAHVHGDAASVGGVPVGDSPSTTVKLSDFSTAPYLVPAPFQAPGNVREVFTQIRNLTLSSGPGSGQRSCTNSGSPSHGVPPSLPIGVDLVRAGLGLVPPTPPCLGQVQSMVAGGGPGSDFPAISFFDMFVEINLPTFAGWPGALLRNSDPLIVQEGALAGFPPHAIYIHGETVAVPLYFRDNGPSWTAGQLFGYLTLAGHGTDIPCAPDPDANAQTRNFLDKVLGPTGNKPGAPLPQPSLVETCPPPRGVYASPADTQPVAFIVPGLGTILARKFRHSNLTDSIIPPPLGSSSTYEANNTRLDLEYSQDGGQSWIPGFGFGNVAVSIKHTSDSGPYRFFETEMLALNISGGNLPPGVGIRESPSKVSTGKTTIQSAGNEFKIGSFFDVFLELSLDNGANHFPSVNETRVDLEVVFPNAIPTLSEWGLIIFALLLATLGSIYIRRSQPAFALAGSAAALSPTPKTALYEPAIFFKVLMGTAAVVLVGFAVAFWRLGSIAPLDIVGSWISAVIFAYWIHLLVVWRVTSPAKREQS